MAKKSKTTEEASWQASGRVKGRGGKADKCKPSCSFNMTRRRARSGGEKKELFLYKFLPFPQKRNLLFPRDLFGFRESYGDLFML